MTAPNCGLGHDPERISCEAAAELVRLRQEVEALRADNERLAQHAGEAVARQTTLRGMTVEEGAVVLELGLPRELVIAFVHAAREMLGDAENYCETRIDFPSVSMEVKAAGEWERYALVVQRAGKLTPHEARRRAEAERDAMSQMLRAMARRVGEQRAGAQDCYARRYTAEQFLRYAPPESIKAYRAQVSAALLRPAGRIPPVPTGPDVPPDPEAAR